jgi:hypothetical protein
VATINLNYFALLGLSFFQHIDVVVVVVVVVEFIIDDVADNSLAATWTEPRNGNTATVKTFNLNLN